MWRKKEIAQRVEKDAADDGLCRDCYGIGYDASGLHCLSCSKPTIEPLTALQIWVLLGMVAIILYALVFIFGYAYPKIEGPRKINCDIAEISPDFTTQMREQCRAARRAAR